MKRASMVKHQIRQRGIRDERVLQAAAAVERHEFVPDFAKDEAYTDAPLPIGHGQTISQPYIAALMSSELQVEPGDKILEVGAGSGYQAALLAEMGARVFSVELVEELAQQARINLKRAGYDDVMVRQGDGAQGWEDYAPFQGIIVTCSPAGVPEALKDQLDEGGRIVIPVGSASMQELVVLAKTGGTFAERRIAPVRFVPMQNLEGRRY